MNRDHQPIEFDVTDPEYQDMLDGEALRLLLDVVEPMRAKYPHESVDVVVSRSDEGDVYVELHVSNGAYEGASIHHSQKGRTVAEAADKCREAMS